MIDKVRGNVVKENVDTYIVFDLETTGISPRKDKIIEISAVKVKEGEIIDTFSTLVNPLMPIPVGASAVNHITDDMVANAPTIEKALPLFIDFIEDYVLVGHNIVNFDLKFIRREVENVYGISYTINNNYIDTLPMARRVLPDLEHHRLVDLAEYYKLSTDGAHRAFNDCIMNQKCYENMCKEEKLRPVDKENEMICPKCGNLLVKRNGIYGEFFGCKSYPHCKHTEKI